MRSSARGIALIASLIVLVAVMAFGAGSIFLAQSSLGQAGSQRAHLLAKTNAEVGIEVAHLVLQTSYAAGAGLPASSLAIPTSPAAGISYQLLEYTPLPVGGPFTQARVRVLGTAGSSASFQSEALFAITPGSAVKFPVGLVSENVVAVDGNIENLVNAQIHGNTGFALGDTRGNYQECDENDVCVSLAQNDWPVTASPGATTCTVTTLYAGFCSDGAPTADRLVPPVEIGPPPYDATRDEVFGTVGTSAAGNTLECDFTVDSPSNIGTYAAGTTVCVASGGTIDGQTLDGITVIVYGDLQIKGNTNLTNTNVLATGTLLQEGNTYLTTSRLFSDDWLWIKGNVYSNGSTTIATGSTLNSASAWDGNALRIEGNIMHTDPNQDVGLLMMSTGGTWVKGNLEPGASMALHALVWSGNQFTVEGNVNLRGGISSVGRLSVNGSVLIDGRANLMNADLPADANVRFASWR